MAILTIERPLGKQFGKVNLGFVNKNRWTDESTNGYPTLAKKSKRKDMVAINSLLGNSKFFGLGVCLQAFNAVNTNTIAKNRMYFFMMMGF
jgi:hypothetical protein